MAKEGDGLVALVRDFVSWDGAVHGDEARSRVHAAVERLLDVGHPFAASEECLGMLALHVEEAANNGDMEEARPICRLVARAVRSPHFAGPRIHDPASGHDRGYGTFLCDDVDAAAAVLDAGIPIVNESSEDDRPTLFWASHRVVARLLLARGADARARIPGGTTVLHCWWLSDAFGALLAAGADVDALDDDGVTALSRVLDADTTEGSRLDGDRLRIARAAQWLARRTARFEERDVERAHRLTSAVVAWRDNRLRAPGHEWSAWWCGLVRLARGAEAAVARGWAWTRRRHALAMRGDGARAGAEAPGRAAGQVWA